MRTVKLVLSDGKDYEFSPLRLADLRKHMPVLKKFTAMRDEGNLTLTPELFEDLSSLICTAFARVNPEMSKEAIENVVDMQDVRNIFSAVISGEVPENAQPKPEDKKESVADDSTGGH